MTILLIVPVLLVVACFLGALVIAHRRSYRHEPRVFGPMGSKSVHTYVRHPSTRMSQLEYNMVKYRVSGWDVMGDEELAAAVKERISYEESLNTVYTVDQDSVFSRRK